MFTKQTDYILGFATNSAFCLPGTCNRLSYPAQHTLARGVFEGWSDKAKPLKYTPALSPVTKPIRALMGIFDLDIKN
jgi:hypothetical protein